MAGGPVEVLRLRQVPEAVGRAGRLVGRHVDDDVALVGRQGGGERLAVAVGLGRVVRREADVLGRLARLRVRAARTGVDAEGDGARGVAGRRLRRGLRVGGRGRRRRPRPASLSTQTAATSTRTAIATEVDLLAPALLGGAGRPACLLALVVLPRQLPLPLRAARHRASCSSLPASRSRRAARTVGQSRVYGFAGPAEPPVGSHPASRRPSRPPRERRSC